MEGGKRKKVKDAKNARWNVKFENYGQTFGFRVLWFRFGVLIQLVYELHGGSGLVLGSYDFRL